MLAALLLLLQADTKPTVDVERLEISRSSSFPYVEVDVSATYPPKSMLTIELAPGHYTFLYYDDRFSWTPTLDFSRNSTSIEIPKDGRRRNVKLPVPSAGIYDLRIRFEINRQAFPDRIRPKIEPYWHDATLDQRTLAVGFDERVSRDLVVDARECRKLLAACRQAVDKIAEIAEKAEKDWEPKLIAELEKLEKTNGEVMARRPSTLLQGTYELVEQVSGNVLMSKDLVKAYYYERKKREKQGKPLDGLSIETYSMGGDLDEVVHPPDPEEQGPPADLTRRGRVSYRRMLAQLEKCVDVYRREATIWTLRFIDMLLADLAALESAIRGGALFAEQGAAVGEAARLLARIRDQAGTLGKEDDYAATWKLDDEKENFPAVVARIEAYQTALLKNLAGEKVEPETPEPLAAQKRELEAALEAWMTRVRGSDKD